MNTDTLVSICKFLSLQDIVKLGLLNKHYRKLQSDNFWSKLGGQPMTKQQYIRRNHAIINTFGKRVDLEFDLYKITINKGSLKINNNVYNFTTYPSLQLQFETINLVMRGNNIAFLYKNNLYHYNEVLNIYNGVTHFYLNNSLFFIQQGKAYRCNNGTDNYDEQFGEFWHLSELPYRTIANYAIIKI